MGAAPALGQPAQCPRQRQQSCPGAAQGQTVTCHAVCTTELAATILANATIMPAHVRKRIPRMALPDDWSLLPCQCTSVHGCSCPATSPSSSLSSLLMSPYTALREFSPALQQVLAVAEIREDLEQQLQRIERHRQALTERKVAEQRRLIRLLDAQLKEACDACSAQESGLRELLGDTAGQLQACAGERSRACPDQLLHARHICLQRVERAARMPSQSW